MFSLGVSLSFQPTHTDYPPSFRHLKYKDELRCKFSKTLGSGGVGILVHTVFPSVIYS